MTYTTTRYDSESDILYIKFETDNSNSYAYSLEMDEYFPSADKDMAKHVILDIGKNNTIIAIEVQDVMDLANLGLLRSWFATKNMAANSVRQNVLGFITSELPLALVG